MVTSVLTHCQSEGCVNQYSPSPGLMQPAWSCLSQLRYPKFMHPHALTYASVSDTGTLQGQCSTSCWSASWLYRFGFPDAAAASQLLSSLAMHMCSVHSWHDAFGDLSACRCCLQIKRKAPNCHTILEVIRLRWGKAAHLVRPFFSHYYITMCRLLVQTA